MNGWTREAAAILGREARSEWRTRVALSGTALFVAGSLTLTGMALANQPTTPEIASALLWIVLLFTASIGLGRAFVQEAERGTDVALRLHARATAVWAGKFAANALLLLALSLIAAPALLTILHVETPSANYAALGCVLFLGDLAIAAVFTTTSALVAQSSARGGLLPALSFPILVVALLAGVHGTRAALGVGAAAQLGTWKAAAGDLQVLTSFVAIAIAASLLLFDYVWND